MLLLPQIVEFEIPYIYSYHDVYTFLVLLIIFKSICVSQYHFDSKLVKSSICLPNESTYE